MACRDLHCVASLVIIVQTLSSLEYLICTQASEDHNLGHFPFFAIQGFSFGAIQLKTMVCKCLLFKIIIEQ